MLPGIFTPQNNSIQTHSSSCLPPCFIEKNPTFGTSGLLYNTNLVLYDREINSLWSQMLQVSINGNQISTKPEILSAIETRWDSWFAMYPDTQVLSESTGFSRNYARYPYESYRSDDAMIFRWIILMTDCSGKHVFWVLTTMRKTKFILLFYPACLLVILARAGVRT